MSLLGKLSCTRSISHRARATLHDETGVEALRDLRPAAREAQGCALWLSSSTARPVLPRQRGSRLPA